MIQIDWERWADSDDEDVNGNPAGNFQLPPNFQELMKKYADTKGDEHENGCHCGECHPEEDEPDSSCCDIDSSSDDASNESDDEMPPLESAN